MLKVCTKHIYYEGSRQEWCISTIYHAWDTPFWSGTLNKFSLDLPSAGIILSVHHFAKSGNGKAKRTHQYHLVLHNNPSLLLHCSCASLHLSHQTCLPLCGHRQVNKTTSKVNENTKKLSIPISVILKRNKQKYFSFNTQMPLIFQPHLNWFTVDRDASELTIRETLWHKVLCMQCRMVVS